MSDAYAHRCGVCGNSYVVPGGVALVLLACPHCGQAPTHPAGMWLFGQETGTLPLAVERDA